jgi:1,4-dihydroxy-2-naphthoate octaprenyltransferase
VIVASVLVGKHIDKVEADRKASVRSLPVLLGEKRSRLLNKILFLLFYGLVILLVLLRTVGLWVLLSLVSGIRLLKVWRVYGKLRPEQAPEDWPIWPLWYVGWAMYLTRLSGALFVLGLLLNVLVPVIF